jgi:TLD
MIRISLGQYLSLLSLKLVFLSSIHAFQSFSHIHTHTSISTTTYRYIYALNERKSPAGNDFISKFFGSFLPTPEDIGLTRYNRTSRPENYYCTTTEWADPLAEDKDTDIALIRQTLKYTNLEYRPLKIAFDANIDGWNAKSFHNRVDKLGPAVVFVRTASGGILGGYNPTGWVNYGELRGSIAAFLFTFPRGNIENRPIKVPKISGAGNQELL